MSQCLVILGGHRCGTSSVAGALHLMGIPAALDDSPRELLQGRRDNPRGHFEDRRLLSLHEELLRPGGWRNPRVDLAQVTGDWRRRYSRHLQQRASAATVWCVKDPRLCFLAPLLWNALQEACVEMSLVNVERRPEEAIASLLRRERRMPPHEAMAIVHRHDGARRAACLQAAARGCRSLDVEYAQLTGDPEVQLARLAEFAGASVTEAARAFINRADPPEA